MIRFCNTQTYKGKGFKKRPFPNKLFDNENNINRNKGITLHKDSTTLLENLGNPYIYSIV